MAIKKSELIINPDGSVYHLKLKPGDVAKTIITVGDPERVENVTRHFENIELTKQNREFKTVTGQYKGKRISVIATGIGTDNIDIVFNELDALFNVDFDTREVKEILTILNFIRIGTSGGIHPTIPLDSIVVSEFAIGLDGLLQFYDSESVRIEDLEQRFSSSTNIENIYAVKGNHQLVNSFSSLGKKGITVTANGFYGPQSRSIRLKSKTMFVDQAKEFTWNEKILTNLEMETSGIYGMASLLGHKAVSLNAILASRYSGHFSSKPTETVNKLITDSLDIISKT